jgi:hypothetical protein
VSGETVLWISSAFFMLAGFAQTYLCWIYYRETAHSRRELARISAAYDEMHAELLEYVDAQNNAGGGK